MLNLSTKVKTVKSRFRLEKRVIGALNGNGVRKAP